MNASLKKNRFLYCCKISRLNNLICHFFFLETLQTKNYRNQNIIIRMSYINSVQKNALQFEFQQKMKNIDHIAKLAIQNKQRKITQKYGNIQSTAKILKSLIIQFTKKSIKIEQQLREASKIDDLKYQTDYHTKRLQQCFKLSSDLQILITKKRNKIKLYEQECQKLKQSLILVKTENIKKILKIEMLENQTQKLALKQKQQEKHQLFKTKISQNRAFMQTGLSYAPLTIDLLKKQKSQLSKVLWQKINKKIVISKYLADSYQRFKEKLVKQQRKSNLDGLNGSLFFKLQQNNKLSKKLGPTVSRKNKVDQKLIIYDILKQKYSNQMKAETKKQNEIKVVYENFMNFTPIQLLGLIELKGGIENLQKKREFLRTQNNLSGHYQTAKPKKETKVKSIKKENYLKMYILSRQA